MPTARLRERAPTTRRDGVTFLSIYVFLLLALPSRLIFAPLGAAGTPAAIVALLGGAWWLWDRFDRTQPLAIRPHPVRMAALVFVCAVLVSYIAAVTRPSNADELSSSEMGLLLLAGWLGLILICDEGIEQRHRLDLLVRRIALGAGLVATLGVAQFATGMAFTDLIQVPGLTTNNTLTSVLARDGFARPSGTSIHPIEFGVLMAMLLPLTIHVALQRDASGPIRRWFPVLATAIAIPLSISRSAIVGTLVALILLLPTWTKSARRATYAALAVMSLIMSVAVPGVIGTITSLFTGISQDSSALSRTDSYDLALEFITRSPFWGRGFLTFLPSYRILDNQYLGVLIDVGIFGLFSLLALFVVAIVVAWCRRRASDDPATRSLAQALLAAVAVPATCFAFFDAFSFPQISGMTFLVVGLVAALEASSSPSRRRSVRIVRRIHAQRQRKYRSKSIDSS